MKTDEKKATAAILVAITVVVVLYFFSPKDYSFYPRCLFHSLTGLDCPGCGSLRATHELLHGNFKAAFALNPLLVFLLPAMILVSIGHVRGQPSFGENKIWFWLVCGLLILFAVARNLPAFL